MKTLNITFEDSDYKKMKKAKDECADGREQKLSWEDFILIKLIDKVI